MDLSHLPCPPMGFALIINFVLSECPRYERRDPRAESFECKRLLCSTDEKEERATRRATDLHRVATSRVCRWKCVFLSQEEEKAQQAHHRLDSENVSIALLAN